MEQPLYGNTLPSLNVLKNILNGMDAYIYVSDLETDEILFINDKIKEQLGLTDDAVGCKCWKVLQNGFVRRCDSCPIHKLKQDPDTTVVWEGLNTVTGRYYKNTDSVIEWTDGKKVHMQHATDITDFRQAEAKLKRQLQQQELMSAISQNFISVGDLDRLIDNALKMAGEFMSLRGILLAQHDTENGVLIPTNEWSAELSTPFQHCENRLSFIPGTPIYDAIYNIFNPIVVSDVTETPFWIAREQGIQAFIMTPIYALGEFWGVLQFYHCGHAYDWSSSDIQMGKLIGSALSGVLARSLMESRLSSTRQMLTTVLENAPMAIFWKDMDNVYRGCNAYFEEFLRKSADEIIGKKDDQLFLPIFAENNLKFDNQAIDASGERIAYDNHLVNGDGEMRWIHVKKSLIKDSKDQPAFVVGVFEDVTESKLTEQKLRRMSSIINSSPQYIAYVNRAGDFDFFNPATLEITGYSHEELMEKGLSILYDDQTYRQICEEIIPTIFAQGKYDFELPLTRKDGQVRQMAFSAFTIGSDTHGCGAIAKDITQRKQLEQDLIEAKELAEQGSRAKGEFLSRMSHEMRTPMNAIIGMTNIARSSKDPEKKEYCLEKIDNASKHLLGVINDILDMSKIEANKFELSLDEFHLEKMLMNITNVVNFRAEEKTQNLLVSVDEAVPLVLFGDELRLSQVITNLLTNAIKFTPTGGTVTLKVHKTDESVEGCTLLIEVIDNGIGISQEQQSRLFTSFEQADGTTTRKYGGTGLGLAISKRIVELMNGKIWIESELGQGAMFAFTVKIKKGTAIDRTELATSINRDTVRNAPESEALEKETASRDFSSHTLLLAEDVDINREILFAMLEDTQVAIDVAKNGVEALEMFAVQPQKYSLILMDIQMPEMDGYEATRRIRALPDAAAQAVPIIAMTANVFREDIQQCMQAGMNDHIGKPMDIGELLTKLCKYLPARH